MQTSIQEFDSKNVNISVFHLLFLVKLTQYLGFSPLNNFASGKYFDMREGEFVNFCNENSFISPAESVFFAELLKFSIFDSLKIRFSPSIRKILLDKILEFYHLHLEGIGEIKSLSIFRELN